MIFKAKGASEAAVSTSSGFPPVTVPNLLPGEQYEVSVYGQGAYNDGFPSAPVLFVLGKYKVTSA